MNFLDALSGSKAMALALLIWGIGLVFAGGAVLEARLKANDSAKIELVEMSTPSKLLVSDNEIPPALYNRAVARLRVIHPMLEINYGAGRRGRSGGLSIQAASLSDYFSFIFALYDAMTSVPNARWEAAQLCSGEKCGDKPFTAVLKATRKTVTLQKGR